MKKQQESPSFQPEKRYTTLTKEQSRTNGGGTWDAFFRDSREDILSALKEANYTTADGKFAGMDRVLEDALKTPIKNLKKDRQNLVSERELFLRGLEYYRDKNGGFGKAKGLEAKYDELRKQESEETAKEVFQQFIKEEEFDFNDPNDRIEEEAKKFIAETTTDPDVDTFRSFLWDECMKKISKG